MWETFTLLYLSWFWGYNGSQSLVNNFFQLGGLAFYFIKLNYAWIVYNFTTTKLELEVMFFLFAWFEWENKECIGFRGYPNTYSSVWVAYLIWYCFTLQRTTFYSIHVFMGLNILLFCFHLTIKPQTFR